MPSAYTDRLCDAISSKHCIIYTYSNPLPIYSQISGNKKAFSKTGKSPPTTTDIRRCFMALPVKAVRTPASSVIMLPSTISQGVQPVIRLVKKQPTNRPIAVSGKRSGNKVSASAGLNWIAPLEIENVIIDRAI